MYSKQIDIEWKINRCNLFVNWNFKLDYEKDKTNYNLEYFNCFFLIELQALLERENRVNKIK